MYQASFRRKPAAMSLCKSIASAVQWFQIHHGITFLTIHNPAVYISGARVGISTTLVPRLLLITAAFVEPARHNIISLVYYC